MRSRNTIAVLFSLLGTLHAAAPKQVPHNAPRLITADKEGILSLVAPAAKLYGREGENTIAIYDGQMCIGWWTHVDDYAVWDLEVATAGVYDVWLHWSIPDRWANNFFRIDCGESRLVGRMVSTGSFSNFELARYGTIFLEAGRQQFVMRGIGHINGELADLKEVRLTPQGQVPGAHVPDGGLPAATAAAQVQLAPGFQLDLFAAEPMLTNPTSICVDHRGRVWVTEIAGYRMYNVPGDKPRIDRIVVLEDTDEDGRADQSTVFYEGLMMPMSLAVAGDQVFVAESPYLYVLEDRDGDLRADGPPRVLLEGFGGYNDDQALHGLALGPDHKLYMTQGDLSFDVRGPDGRHVQNDVGAVLRCELDGTQLEVVAWDLKNPIETTVNAWGDVWFSGNDDDGKQMCRLDFALEGGYYGWRFWDVYRQRLDQLGSGAAAHWHANEIGVVPPVLITGFGAPCGKLFVEHGLWGDQYRGALLQVDPGPREIRWYFPEPAGAAFRVRSERLLWCDDDTYFRPIDAALAPDGSLLVCDWYDQGVGGHAYNDPARGRIYRVRPLDPRAPDTDPVPRIRNVSAAVAALASPNLDIRYRARQHLLDAGPEAVPRLQRAVQGDDPAVVARGLWLLDRIGGRGHEVVAAQLHHPDPRRRALGVRILRRQADRHAAAILAVAGDRSAEVRREVLLAIRDLESEAAAEALHALARAWDGEDRYYLEAIGIAARGRAGQANGNQRYPGPKLSYALQRFPNRERLDRLHARLLNDAGDELDVRQLRLTQLLKGAEATPHLLELLSRQGVADELRTAMVASLGVGSDAEAGRAVLATIVDDAQPLTLRRLALDVTRQNLPGSWQSLQESDLLRTALAAALDQPQLRGAAIRLVRETQLPWAAPLLVDLARDANVASSDRVAALRALHDLHTPAQAPRLLSLVQQLAAGEVRTATWDLLIAWEDVRAFELLLQDDGQSPAAQLSRVERIGQTRGGALWLLSQLTEQHLSRPLAAAAVQQGVQHVDLAVRTLYWQRLPEEQRPQTLGATVRPAEILERTGDPQRGAQVFHRGQCGRCHLVHEQGTDIGPPLSVIGRKLGADALLQAILEPSAAIAPGYQTSLVETTAGQLHIGFVTQQDDEGLALRKTDGTQLQLKRQEVAAVSAHSQSLMPEQLAGSMTAQQLADLVAYLSSLKRTTQLLEHYWGVGPFENDAQGSGFEEVYAPERQPAAIDRQAEYEGIGGRRISWAEVTSRPIGDSRGIDLQEFLRQQNSRSGNVVAYFAVTIESPATQSAELILGSEDGLAIWLNGQSVHRHLVRRPPRLGDDSVAIDLQQGDNLLLLKLEQIHAGGGLLAALRVEHPVTFADP